MEPRLGHVVLNVRSVAASLPFYRDVLRMRTRRTGTFNGDRMAFLTFGNSDHDLALLEAPEGSSSHGAGAIGLGHIAIRIGDQLDTLREFKRHLDTYRIPPKRMMEHLYTCSIYLSDPDGIEIEVYVDRDVTAPFLEGDVEVTNAALVLSDADRRP